MQLIVLFSVLSAASAGLLSDVRGSSQGIKASADTDVGNVGLDALNLKMSLPFQVNDFLVSVKCSLDSIGNKMPDAIFVSRTMNVGDGGKVSINSNFDPSSKKIDLSTVYTVDNGFTFSADLDSESVIKKVGASTSRELNGVDVVLSAAHSLAKRTTDLMARFKRDATTLSLKMNTADISDINMALNHQIDDRNSIEPSFSVGKGDVAVAWTNTFGGGSVSTKYTYKGDAEVNWKDEGKFGTWNTKATIPISSGESSAKVSVARDFKM